MEEVERTVLAAWRWVQQRAIVPIVAGERLLRKLDLLEWAPNDVFASGHEADRLAEEREKEERRARGQPEVTSEVSLSDLATWVFSSAPHSCLSFLDDRHGSLEDELGADEWQKMAIFSALARLMKDEASGSIDAVGMLRRLPRLRALAERRREAEGCLSSILGVMEPMLAHDRAMSAQFCDVLLSDDVDLISEALRFPNQEETATWMERLADLMTNSPIERLRMAAMTTFRESYSCRPSPYSSEQFVQVISTVFKSGRSGMVRAHALKILDGMHPDFGMDLVLDGLQEADPFVAAAATQCLKDSLQFLCHSRHHLTRLLHILPKRMMWPREAKPLTELCVEYIVANMTAYGFCTSALPLELQSMIQTQVQISQEIKEPLRNETAECVALLCKNSKEWVEDLMPVVDDYLRYDSAWQIRECGLNLLSLVAKQSVLRKWWDHQPRVCASTLDPEAKVRSAAVFALSRLIKHASRTRSTTDESVRCCETLVDRLGSERNTFVLETIVRALDWLLKRNLLCGKEFNAVLRVIINHCEVLYPRLQGNPRLASQMYMLVGNTCLKMTNDHSKQVMPEAMAILLHPLDHAAPDASYAYRLDLLKTLVSEGYVLSPYTDPISKLLLREMQWLLQRCCGPEAERTNIIRGLSATFLSLCTLIEDGYQPSGSMLADLVKAIFTTNTTIPDAGRCNPSVFELALMLLCTIVEYQSSDILAAAPETQQLILDAVDLSITLHGSLEVRRYALDAMGMLALNATELIDGQWVHKCLDMMKNHFAFLLMKDRDASLHAVLQLGYFFAEHVDPLISLQVVLTEPPDFEGEGRRLDKAKEVIGWSNFVRHLLTLSFGETSFTRTDAIRASCSLLNLINSADAFEFVRVDDSDQEDDGDLKLMKAAIKHAVLAMLEETFGGDEEFDEAEWLSGKDYEGMMSAASLLLPPGHALFRRLRAMHQPFS